MRTDISRILSRAKAWIEEFARRPYALGVLFLIAVIEGSVFPVPPDVLFIALGVATPRRAFLFGAVCVAGSVCGGVLGYEIGAALYEPVGRPLVALLGLTNQFSSVLAQYREHAWLTLLLAGFTNIPFCLFTIAAGFQNTLSLSTLFLASLFGRTVRFMLLAALLFYFGPAVERFITRHLPAVTFGLTLVFIVVIVLFRFL